MSRQQSTLQSFPQDHAILSHPDEDHRHHIDLIPSIADDNDILCHPVVIPIRRADSTVNTSEHTPLLQQDTSDPFIHETTDDDVNLTRPSEQVPSAQMFREELGILTCYSLPVFAAQIFEHSFLLASTMCIGHISTVALAAATLGMMTASVTGYSIVRGFASTLDTLLPPAWTSDTPHMVGLWTQRVAVMSVFGLVPILAIWFNAEPIFLFLKQDPEVAHLAAVYLKYASLGLPAYSFIGISRRYFQCQRLFSVPARITIVIAPLNAFLNWFFVYPLGLSFRGAPLATALSFNLVLLASILYAYYFVPRTAWTPLGRDVWHNWGILGRLGIAGIVQTASAWWTWELIGCKCLGPVSLAAQSVLLLSASFTFQAPFALGAATSVRIGNLLGEGRARRAGVVAPASIAIAVAVGCVWCTMFLVFRTKWAYLFNDDPEVVSIVASVLPITALSQMFDGMNNVGGGVLRARGMQVAGAWLNLGAYYILGIPFGITLTFYFGFRLAGLWIGLVAALIYSSIISVWIGVIRADWEVEVKKARERVKGQATEEPH
ncbi:MATE efflux family protein [Scleroderma citrinum]